jgi:hypothetical protein
VGDGEQKRVELEVVDGVGEVGELTERQAAGDRQAAAMPNFNCASQPPRAELQLRSTAASPVRQTAAS